MKVKRILTPALALLLIFTLAACGSSNEQEGFGTLQGLGSPAGDAGPTGGRSNAAGTAADSGKPANQPGQGTTASDAYNNLCKAKFNMLSAVSSAMFASLATDLQEDILTITTLIGKTEAALMPTKIFGQNKATVEMVMAALGKEVTYSENGNTYTLTWLDSAGAKYICEGTYDPAQDWLQVQNTTDGQLTLAFEYRATEYGYIVCHCGQHHLPGNPKAGRVR